MSVNIALGLGSGVWSVDDLPLPVRGNDFSPLSPLSLSFHLFCQSKELIDHFQTFSGPTRCTLGRGVGSAATAAAMCLSNLGARPMPALGVKSRGASVSAGEERRGEEKIMMTTVSLESLSAKKRQELRLRHTCSRSRCRCIMEQERRQRPTKIWKADLNCETEKNLGSISHAIKRNRILSVTHGRPT